MNRPLHFLKIKIIFFYLERTKQEYTQKWFLMRMMFIIHQKLFLLQKKKFVLLFTNAANRPVRKMVLERTVPGGSGFGANRPVTHCDNCKKCKIERFIKKNSIDYLLKRSDCNLRGFE